MIWDNKIENLITQPSTFQIIPIGSIMTPNDDDFFKELQQITPEARKINGYE